MKVALFGGTGFIGKELQKKLQAKGHEPLVLDLRRNSDWESKLSTCDAIVNLAGTSLFSKRWTNEVKSLIHSSRVEGTKKIVAALDKFKKAGRSFPKILVNASAIGFYGPSFDEIITESNPSGSDFLAFVCREWEEAALAAQRQVGIRTAIVRIGVVLGRNGGALDQLLPPFRLGLGGPVGLGGKQWFSWVHVEDVCGLILYALENEKVVGAVNAVSPNPVRNKDFAKTLGKVLSRPAFIPLPGLALYALLGEVAEILVNGQRVLPEKTQSLGYNFLYPDLEKALKNIV